LSSSLQVQLFRSLPGRTPWQVAAMGTKERDQRPLAARATVEPAALEPAAW